MNNALVAGRLSPESPQQAARRTRGRPRARLACITCRIRKVKCDVTTAENNICRPCRVSNETCIISVRNVKNTGPRTDTTDEITALRQRLSDLEESMADKGAHQIPPVPDKPLENLETIALNNPLSSYMSQTPSSRLPRPPLPPHATATAPDYATAIQQHESVFEAQFHGPYLAPITHATSAQYVSGMGQPNTVNDMHYVERHPTYNPASVTIATSKLPEAEIDRFRHEKNQRDKPGFSIHCHQPGNLGVFGSPSHWQSQPYARASPPSVDSNTTIETESFHVKRAIMDIYWTSNELWHNVVDKEQFMVAKAGGDNTSNYYSPALEYAMLACGARHSTSSAIRRVARIYAERAKIGLLTQIERPSVATIQMLLLVANFEGGDGNLQIGWTYAGIALRMLYDLRIHEDCLPLVKAGRLTAEEVASRRRLLLAAFVYDTLWAWVLVRPRSISLPLVVFTRSHCWDEMASTINVPRTLNTWVDLCIELAEVVDVLNMSTLDDLAVRRLSQIWASVGRLSDTLPDELAWRDSKTSPAHPAAYALCTQLATLKIHLHRIPKRRCPPEHGSKDFDERNLILDGFTAESSQAVVYENAVRIARLVCLHVDVHGIEQIIPTVLDNIYVAAMMLIEHISNTQQLRTQESLQSTEKDMVLLETLAQTLAKAEKHLALTSPIRKSLSVAVQGTQLAKFFNVDDSYQSSCTDQSAQVDSAPVTPQHIPVFNSTAMDFEACFMDSFAFGTEQSDGVGTDAFRGEAFGAMTRSDDLLGAMTY